MTQPRQFPIGISSLAPIEPGDTAQCAILNGPQALRYVELAVPPEFDVVDLRIDDRSEFWVEGYPVGGSVFSGLKVGGHIPPNTIVELTVRNRGGSPAWLAAGLLCELDEPADVVRSPPQRRRDKSKPEPSNNSAPSDPESPPS